MSERDIPVVPVTTLAGLTSLSDCKWFNLYKLKIGNIILYCSA